MKVRRTRVVRATRLGIVTELIVLGLFVLAPLVLLERGFGLDAPPETQVLILAIGLPLCVLGLNTVRAYLPKGQRLEVEVTKKELVFHRNGQPPDAVPRGDVGLVVLYDEPMQGVRQIKVHDRLSGDIDTWDTAWLGRQHHRVERILDGFGYPCAIASELYGGRFMAQTPGQPPRLERPAPIRKDSHGPR